MLELARHIKNEKKFMAKAEVEKKERVAGRGSGVGKGEKEKERKNNKKWGSVGCESKKYYMI